MYDAPTSWLASDACFLDPDNDLSSKPCYIIPKPFSNIAPKIAIKRKRAPVSPFATRGVLKQALSGFIDKGTILELQTPNEWRIHPSLESRGSGFQHERLVWGDNDHDDWAMVKIRQHASDPSRTTRRTSFEGFLICQPQRRPRQTTPICCPRRMTTHRPTLNEQPSPNMQ